MLSMPNVLYKVPIQRQTEKLGECECKYESILRWLYWFLTMMGPLFITEQYSIVDLQWL